MLETVHLADRDIQFVSLEGQDMPAALEKHNVDAVSIWEPHAENSLTVLGKDAVVFEDGAAYTERFNLNTRTDVLSDPAKRTALAALIREIGRASNQIRTRPGEMIPALAPKIGYKEQLVTAVWRQFTFPAALNGRLRPALNEVEAWVAANQKRQPRPPQELTDLIDFRLIKGGF
jgi:NitT/TauT family transport system substrate-binding protein